MVSIWRSINVSKIKEIFEIIVYSLFFNLILLLSFFFVGWNWTWINFDHLKKKIILTYKKKVEILEKEKTNKNLLQSFQKLFELCSSFYMLFIINHRKD